MSQKYYYFLSSLPTLFFGQKSPLPLEEFLERCESLLHPNDNREVRAALLEDPSAKQGAAFHWSQMRHHFKNELAYERALRAGKDPMDFVRGERSYDSFLRDIVVESLDAQDPLESQKLFYQKMWGLLDDMESGHYFDRENAVIYALRLNILQKMEEINSNRGQETFENYMNNERLSAVYAAVKE